MDILYPRCAGLDIHKKSLVVCILLADAQGHQDKQFHSFFNTPVELQRLRDLLTSLGVTHVAMKNTGVFWKTVYDILEDYVTLLVVNIQHIKFVPGRKANVKDAEWIADLLQHGLLRPIAVPSREQRVSQELAHHRASIIQGRAHAVVRLKRNLEHANLKISSLISDRTDASAIEILHALIDDTSVLDQLAPGQIHDKMDLIEDALPGSLQSYQRFLIAEPITLLDMFDESIKLLSTQIAELQASTPT